MMSKETKQDRIVRGMFDQLTEHLHELKALESNILAKELDVERWCQSLLRTCLGFTVTNGYTILAQEARGKMRPDLVITKNNKPIIVVEIKKLGFDLDKSDFRSGKTQLAEYLKHIGNVKWGLLCNGHEWRLYDFSDLTFGGIEVIRFDLRNDDNKIDTSKKEVEDTCWDFIDLHETAYDGGEWTAFSKEENAFSPESLAKAILNHDSVKYLARVIRGEHEYKANVDVLIEKLFILLEKGLNDTGTWNDSVKHEFGKYIKSQKRMGRKKKRVKKEEVTSVSLAPTTESLNVALVPADPTKVSA
jgi:hypothetical protein